MTSRRSTRSSRGNKKVDILLTDINSYSTCIDLSLIRSLCCDNCLGIFYSSHELIKKAHIQKKDSETNRNEDDAINLGLLYTVETLLHHLHIKNMYELEIISILSWMLQ